MDLEEKGERGGGDEDRDEEGRGIKVQGVGRSSMIYGQGLWVSHNLAGAVGSWLPLVAAVGFGSGRATNVVIRRVVGVAR